MPGKAPFASSAKNLADLLGTSVLASIAQISATSVLSGQPVPARLSRRRRFPRLDVYYDEYLGHKPQEGKLPGHYHDWPELATVLDGRLNVVIGSTVYEAQQGDWLVFRSGVSHTECCLSSQKAYRLFWMILLPDGQLGLHQTSYHRSAGYQVLDACHFRDVPTDLRSGIQRLATSEWEPLRDVRWEFVKTVNWCLGGLLGEVSETIDFYHPRVALAKEILEKAAGQPPSVTELANRVGLSPNYLSNLFHRYTGQTIRQFVQNHRIELACRLLADPVRSIKEIGYQLSFTTPQHFTYVFRRATGMTPAAYRRRLNTQRASKP